MPRILETVCETLGWEVGACWTHEPEAGCCGVSRRGSAISADFSSLRGPVLNSTLPRESVCRDSFGVIGNRGGSLITPTLTFLARGCGHRGSSLRLCVPDLFQKAIPRSDGIFQREIRDADEDLLKIFGSIGSQIGQFIERKEAGAALEKSKELLEQRVRERTRELRAANKD